MKKYWILAVLALMLTGCKAEPTFETLGEIPIENVSAEAQQIVISLPTSAKATEKTETGGEIYLCDGYTLLVETKESGDLRKTLQEVTGYDRSNLDVIETMQGDVQRYSCVWTSAGEEELQVGRTCVLDDGHYHYVLTALADESKSGELQEAWRQLFGSFYLVDADVDLNTGS